MALSVGISASIDSLSNKLLWTPTPDQVFTAKFLADQNHIIEGEFCHLFYNQTEYVWVYTGKDDPCDELNIKPRFSVIVPMAVKVNDKKVICNVRFPKSVRSKILSIAGIVAPNSLDGAIVKIRRDDSGKFTKYEIKSAGTWAPVIEFDQDGWVNDFTTNKIWDCPAKEIRERLIAEDVPFDGSVNRGWDDGPSTKEEKW